MLMVTVFSRCSALFCKAKTVCKYALIICCGLVIAGCGGGSSAVDEPEENTSGTVPPVVEEPVEEPEVITVPYDMPRDGRIEGVHIWQLPDSPEGDRPDQCWLAVGSDATGEIYISGHDHQTNSMLYRLYQADNSLRWIGDARTASQEANNWQANETAQKFHTRPINLNGNVYVATLDSSDMNNSYLNTRGFHWYGYAISENRFIDLSATEPNGVGSPTLQLATIQKDPRNNLLYGMSIPENKLVRYDIAKAQTTVLGKPSAWTNFFYTNRFMWVDSRGRVYITGGSSRAQWNQGEPRAVFNHVWYYDPVSGFGELPNFALQGPNFDGHDYVGKACASGAAGAVVSARTEDDIAQIAVDDAKLALGRFSAAWRQSKKARVVGITGSNGKTTLKELVAACLRTAAPTLATEGNLNNDIGMPLMLARLDDEHEYAVLEMGANHAGEIANLASLAQPDVVVITNIF